MLKEMKKEIVGALKAAKGAGEVSAEQVRDGDEITSSIWRSDLG